MSLAEIFSYLTGNIIGVIQRKAIQYR